MSILKIAKLGHPVLLKESIEIKQFSTDSLKKIVYDMSETMIDYNGVGLAAPQVHLSQRLFIFRNPDIEETKEIQITAVINPIVEKISDETNESWEGCLSIPGMLGLVRRFSKIKYSEFDTSEISLDKFLIDFILLVLENLLFVRKSLAI